MTHRCLLFALAMTAAACGSGTTDPDDPGTVEVAQILAIIDGDNAGNASDVHVLISPPADPAGISVLRLFLLDPADAGSFDLTAAEAAPTSSYVDTPASGEARVVAFPANASTVGGGTVGDGGSFVVRILSVASGGSEAPALSSPSAAVTLAVTPLVKTLVSSLNAGAAGFSIDSDGNLYVSDIGPTWNEPTGSTIYRITPAGVVSQWSSVPGGPAGHAFAPNGDLIQISTSSQQVYRIPSSGTASEWATGVPGGIGGVAVADDGTVYAAECSNNIYRIEPDGSESLWFSHQNLACPAGLDVGPNGDLYVTSRVTGNVQRVTPGGDLIFIANLPGGSAGQVVYGNGVLYAVDGGGHRIYEVSLTGETRVLAGDGTVGTLDGSATEATLSSPFSVVLSPDGSILYFIDRIPDRQPGDIRPISIRTLTLDP